MDMRKKKKTFKLLSLVLIISICTAMTGCTDLLSAYLPQQSSITIDDIPEYDGQPYVIINGNVPSFTDEEYEQDTFEYYNSLDYLGRCTYAYANIGEELMPTEPRGSIGQVKPTGWHLVKYDFIDGKYLYNRCHLIGYQLTGENANENNLITGTRYMNTEGMLPFENLVDDYIESTGDNVLYRVTPVYDGENLLADGVQMEASSVSDKGASLQFNVFVYNVQPGVEIDYTDGDNWLADDDDSSSSEDAVLEIRGNKRSKIYHCPGQRAYEDMADSKNLVVFDSEEEAQAAGYRKAQQ